MNEELIARALRMLEDRAKYWMKTARPWSYAEDVARASAYNSAVEILRSAMEGNIECLAQFDAYREEEEG